MFPALILVSLSPSPPGTLKPEARGTSLFPGSEKPRDCRLRAQAGFGGAERSDPKVPQSTLPGTRVLGGPGRAAEAGLGSGVRGQLGRGPRGLPAPQSGSPSPSPPAPVRPGAP